jgi:hypothetical protein
VPDLRKVLAPGETNKSEAAEARPHEPVFRACPRLRCFAPSGAFRNRDAAEKFAACHARQSRVGYAVYQVVAGRLKLLKLFDPPPAPG